MKLLFENWRQYLNENLSKKEVEQAISDASFNSAQSSQHRWGRGQPIIDYTDTPDGRTYTATYPDGTENSDLWPSRESKPGEDLETFLKRVEEPIQLNLVENWRQYLNEGAVTLQNWPDGYDIQIEKNLGDKNPYIINLYEKINEKWENVGFCAVEDVSGQLTPSKNLDDFYDCEDDFEKFENLYTVHIAVDEHLRSKGFGPFMMDIAFELAWMQGKWIIPPILPNSFPSKGAHNLLKFYYDNRADVEQYDFEVDCFELYIGKKINEQVPVYFSTLYRKDPTILRDKLAGKYIQVIQEQKKLKEDESLYYGTSTVFQEEIAKNGIKSPSKWGNYGFAEENAMKIVEKHGGEPAVIQIPLSEFKDEHFLLDESNNAVIIYTEDFHIFMEKQEKKLV